MTRSQIEKNQKSKKENITCKKSKKIVAMQMAEAVETRRGRERKNEQERTEREREDGEEREGKERVGRK